MHFREECKHGKVGAQCRCASPDRKVHVVSCEQVNCDKITSLTNAQIDEIAYQEIFQAARSMLDFWIDEEGEYSEEDFEKIRKRCAQLVDELEQRYV
jgi:hypothetical protein